MSKSRAPLFLGLTAAGGVGYYLFSAGGNPKVAENKFESDVHKAAATAKDKLPIGRDPNATGYAAEAGGKIDKAFAKVDEQAGRAKSNAEAYGKDAKAEALKAVDKFDTTVENEAAKAKSSVSGWFGGSK